MTQIVTTPNDVELAVSRLDLLRKELNGRLVEREQVIDGAVVSLISGTPMFLYGPPGTAKTMLIETLAKLVSSGAQEQLNYFVYLMSKTTSPEELFGAYDLQAYKQGIYKRDTRGKLSVAHIALLDETFKSNSLVLNLLLRLINEGVWMDGNDEKKANLITLFGASNELPQEEELQAFWDRLLIRMQVGYLSDSGLRRMMELQATGVLSTPIQAVITLDDIRLLQYKALKTHIPGYIFDNIFKIKKGLMEKGITVSDRRWSKCMQLMQASAVSNGHDEVEEEDMAVLIHSLWEQPQQRKDVASVIMEHANPVDSRTIDLLALAKRIQDETFMTARKATDNQAKYQALVDGITKIRKTKTELDAIVAQAQQRGKQPKKAITACEDVQVILQEMGLKMSKSPEEW